MAAGNDPLGVNNFRPSEEVRQYVAELVAREKSEGLTEEETSELEHYLQLEHIMRLAKARAKLFPSSKQTLKDRALAIFYAITSTGDSLSAAP